MDKKDPWWTGYITIFALFLFFLVVFVVLPAIIPKDDRHLEPAIRAQQPATVYTQTDLQLCYALGELDALVGVNKTDKFIANNSLLSNPKDFYSKCRPGSPP